MNRRLQLLLLDDDDAQVRLLNKVVSRSFPEHVDLTAMTDPEQAREWIRANRPEIVLTDLEMPTVSGLEILRVARHCQPVAQVLLLTAHTSTKAIVDAMEFGATDYLLKPLDPDELIRLLDQAIERISRWQRAFLQAVQSPRRSDEIALCP